MTTPKAGDVLKSVRCRLMSVDDVARDLEASRASVRRILVSDLAPNGIVAERVGERRAVNGRPPTEYSLARAWGGQG